MTSFDVGVDLVVEVDFDGDGDADLSAQLLGRFFEVKRTLSYIGLMNGPDRRRSPRVPVSVYLHQHVEGQTHRCFSTNLSSSGLYMERPIASFVRHSTSVQLEIPLPDGEPEPVWASAEVVYDCFDALFHGTAVRFVALGSHDQARINAFLAHNGGENSLQLQAQVA